MSDQDQESINRAADRMYDAIRDLLRANSPDAFGRAIAAQANAADAYDQAIERLGPSPLVRVPVDVSRN